MGGGDIPLYGDLGEGHSRRREQQVQRPQARTRSRGKGPAEKWPGGIMWEATGLAPGSQHRSGPSIRLWLLCSRSCLSPSALSGFTPSQLGDPGQAASLLSAFALGCLTPVWALQAPGVGAGPTAAAQM